MFLGRGAPSATPEDASPRSRHHPWRSVPGRLRPRTRLAGLCRRLPGLPQPEAPPSRRRGDRSKAQGPGPRPESGDALPCRGGALRALLPGAAHAPVSGRAAPRLFPGLRPLGRPVGPGRRVPAPLPLQLLLQPLLLPLQVGGHVVAGGLVEAAEATVCASRACAGGTRGLPGGPGRPQDSASSGTWWPEGPPVTRNGLGDPSPQGTRGTFSSTVPTSRRHTRLDQ